MVEELTKDEIVDRVFECKYKDIQPFKDKEGNTYIGMTEETYNYMMRYESLFNHLNNVFNRNLFNILNDDLDKLDYSEPLIEKWQVREMLKKRLEVEKNEL